MKICVLGAGSWGIALTKLLATNNHELTVWSIDPEEISMLKEFGQHTLKLPGVMLPGTVEYTTDIEIALKDKDLIVMAVPSPFVRGTAKKASEFIEKDKIIVNVAKGIEEDSLKRLSEVIAEEIPQARIAVLSGPSHAEEVGKCLPTTVVVGAADKGLAKTVQDTFMSDFFRVYTSPDMIGIELGGAIKNVIALAAGIADGLGCGDLMGQGKTYQEAMDEVKMVVEGVYSAKAALSLANKYDVEMPIVEYVNKILFEDYSAKDALHDLITRDRKKEASTLTWSN